MEALGYRLGALLARDAWSAWYHAETELATYATSSVVIRVFDEPHDDDHREILSDARFGLRYRHECIWGPIEWPEGELACRIVGVEGWCLIDVVRAGPLPAATAVRVGRDLCSANQFLETHPAGGAHGVPDGERVIVGIDGVTRIEEPMSSRLPTSARNVAQLMPPMTRFAFMSPERIKGLPATSLSAVREVGAVLHALLTGEVAHRQESLFATLQAMISKPLPSLVQLGTIDAELAETVDSACALAPEDRIANVAALGARLDAIAARLGEPTQPPHARLDEPPGLVPFAHPTRS